MKAVKKATALVVRPRSDWDRHVLVSLITFGLIVAVVSFLLQCLYPNPQRQKASRAIATLRENQDENQDNVSDKLILKTSFNLADIKKRLESPELLQQVLNDCGIKSSVSDDGTQNASSITVNQLQQGLVVYSDSDSDAGAKNVVIDLMIYNSPEAKKLARAMASIIVQDYRSQWESQNHQAHLAAADQVEQAWEERNLALTKLRGFCEDKSKQVDFEPKSSQPKVEFNKPTVVTEQPVTQSINNPVWIELNGKLIALKQQETAMLANRTSDHPEVQYTQGIIENVQKQLAATPRWISEMPVKNDAQQNFAAIDNSASTLDAREEPNRTTPAVIFNNPETKTVIDHLQYAVNQADKNYQEKLATEKQIFKVCALKPDFSVQINEIAIRKTHQVDRHGLIGLIFLSGFVMAFGVGVFSTGISAEPPLGSIADLEPLLPAPIIGVVPHHNRWFDPVLIKYAKVMQKWAQILLGVVVIFSCCDGIYWFFTHMKYFTN